MYLLLQLFLFSGMSGRLSFPGAIYCARDTVSTVQWISNLLINFLDQGKEKLFLMEVTLLTLSFSDPDPHLIIRKSLLGLLLVYL